MLAIGSLDNTVKLWDVPNSKLRCILEGHRGSVVALSLHQRRPLFATMGWDDMIGIWSSETWDVLAVITCRPRARVGRDAGRQCRHGEGELQSALEADQPGRGHPSLSNHSRPAIAAPYRGHAP
jgi:WD40 repeat protein